jgi:acyl carrier protein
MNSHDTTTTFARLTAMLAQDHKLPLDRLTPDAPLEGLGIDSLGMVEMLWNVEDKFRIKLPLKTVELHTVADVVRYIDELVAAQGARPPAAAAARPAERSAAASRTT